MAYPYEAIIPVGTPGLTLTASVVDRTGAALGSQPGYTVVDIGGGLYLYTTDAMPDGQRGVVKLLSGAGTVGAAVVSPRESENADVKLSTAQIAAAEFTITPFQALVTNPRYVTRNAPPIAQGSQPTDVWILTDSTGVPLNLSGKTIRLVGYLSNDPDRDQPYDEIQTPAFKYETGGAGIAVTGPSFNQVNVTHDSAKTAVPGPYSYYLWNITDDLPLAKGKMPIEPAVKNYP